MAGRWIKWEFVILSALFLSYTIGLLLFFRAASSAAAISCLSVAICLLLFVALNELYDCAADVRQYFSSPWNFFDLVMHAALGLEPP